MKVQLIAIFVLAFFLSFSYAEIEARFPGTQPVAVAGAPGSSIVQPPNTGETEDLLLPLMLVLLVVLSPLVHQITEAVFHFFNMMVLMVMKLLKLLLVLLVLISPLMMLVVSELSLFQMLKVNSL